MTKASLLGLLTTVLGLLKILFAPAELKKAFTAALGTSTALGFAVAFLTTVGTDSAANPAGGLVAAIVSYVLLTVAGKLATVQAAHAVVPVAHVAAMIPPQAPTPEPGDRTESRAFFEPLFERPSGDDPQRPYKSW